MKLLNLFIAAVASTTVSASSFRTPDLEEGKTISHDAIIKLESQKHTFFPLSGFLEKKKSSNGDIGDKCFNDSDCDNDLFCDIKTGKDKGKCKEESTSRSGSRNRIDDGYAGSTCDRDQDCKKGFFCNNNDRCEATTSNSGDNRRNRTDDDCKDVNKNLRRSGANKSGCKVDARGKRTAQQNKRGGNKSGNRENEDGPCLSNSNCDDGQRCCGANFNGRDNQGVCRSLNKSCPSSDDVRNGRSGSTCKKDKDCNGNLECINKRCDSMDAFAAVVA